MRDFDTERATNGVWVDDLVDEREATIKNTGLQDAAVGATAGAIPMDDGTVVVMLNVNSLFEMAGRKRRKAAASPTPARKQSRNTASL